MIFFPEYKSCSFCNSELKLFATHKTVLAVDTAVLFCHSCRYGVTTPTPDDELLHVLHSTQYYRNGEGKRFIASVEWLVEGMRRWRVHRLLRVVTTGSVLDVGCGSGKFLRVLRDEGWDVAGLELNDDTATGARLVQNIRVETNLNAFADKTFDLITITHVLEHVRDPLQILVDCRRLLKPGGIIAVATPNIESWQARVMRGHWFHLDLPRHLWHFSEAWLTYNIRDLGFEQIGIRRLDIAHNTFGWFQSTLNIIGLRHNRLYSFLSRDDLETGNRSYYLSLCMSLCLAPLLIPLAMFLSVLEVMFHAGGTVEITARMKDSESDCKNNRV